MEGLIPGILSQIEERIDNENVIPVMRGKRFPFAMLCWNVN